MDEENLTQSTNTNAVEEKKGLSVASLVLGILSLVLFCFWYISLPCAIIAIILGAIGRKKGGKGMGTAGIVLGIISIVLILILLALASVGIVMLSNMDTNTLNSLSSY